MKNRNNDQQIAYFELGEEKFPISVEARQEEVNSLLEKIEKSQHCVGVKLNPAWETLSKKYPQLEEKVLERSCYAVNAATC